MKQTRSGLGDIVCETLTEHPTLPSRTIARVLVSKHPDVFSDVEQARRLVRSYRGQTGKKNRSGNFAGGRFYNQKYGEISIELPEPIRESDEWIKVPVSFKRGLFLYDVHLPFHSTRELNLAIGAGKSEEVDCVVLGGDVFDFYAMSSFDRNPSITKLSDEVDTGMAFLEHIRDQFPKAQIIMLEGNHEERLWRYLWRRCPELSTLTEFGLSELIHASDYSVRVISGRKPLLAGPHLHVLHGHEFASRIDRAVNPARGLFMRSMCNAICGHVHTTSSHTEQGLAYLVSTWSVGCLCKLHPQYMPINRWNHGFAIVELAGDNWSVSNRKIVNGAIV